MKIEHWKLLKKISATYISLVIILFVCGLVVQAIVEFGSKPSDFVGCSSTGDVFFIYECSGFLGAKVFSFALNFPLYHLYIPLFVVIKPISIFAAIGMWLLPVMFVLSYVKLFRNRT